MENYKKKTIEEEIREESFGLSIFLSIMCIIATILTGIWAMLILVPFIWLAIFGASGAAKSDQNDWENMMNSFLNYSQKKFIKKENENDHHCRYCGSDDQTSDTCNNCGAPI